MKDTPVIRCLYGPAARLGLGRAGGVAARGLQTGLLEGARDQGLAVADGGLGVGRMDALAAEARAVHLAVGGDDDEIGRRDFLGRQRCSRAHRSLRLDADVMTEGVGGLCQTLGRHESMGDAGGQDVTATMRLAPAPVSGACPCAIAAAMMRSGAASAIQARHAASQSCLRRPAAPADQQQDIAGLGRGAGIGLLHAGGVADFDIAVPAAFRGRLAGRARNAPATALPPASMAIQILFMLGFPESRWAAATRARPVGDDGRRGQVGAGQPELGDGEGDRQARHALGIRLFGQGRGDAGDHGVARADGAGHGGGWQLRMQHAMLRGEQGALLAHRYRHQSQALFAQPLRLRGDVPDRVQRLARPFGQFVAVGLDGPGQGGAGQRIGQRIAAGVQQYAHARDCSRAIRRP